MEFILVNWYLIHLSNNNTVTTSGADAYSIYSENSDSNFTYNTLTTTGVDAYGIYICANRSIVNFNTINTTGNDAVGIVLEDSVNTSVYNNTISVSSLHALGLFPKSGGIMNNVFTNNIILSPGFGAVYDGSNTSYNNTLIFSNEFGAINWTLGNLTTNVNLSVGSTVFLENNLVGMQDSSSMLELNGSATIKFFGLTHSSTPQLLKNGVRCDDGDNCNITYSSGTLTANVISFSNYTTYLPTPQSGGSSNHDDDDDTVVEEEVIEEDLGPTLDEILASWETASDDSGSEDNVEETEELEEAVDETETTLAVDQSNVDVELEVSESDSAGLATETLFKTKRFKSYAVILIFIAILGVLAYFIKQKKV
jgi:hypothetical protein